ncbi:MAG: dTDP-4-dehydrorhamnose 3,5-epimerase [Candidatus Glassbacteria bacterium RIFCSPLOWO2_12_FULL_58_11]|uniref:dTDP-4-dehydrorhamnose 3,5-epimerase n=1 Tax=Candidatus Glassbacteria bacterium RIFCSPLOWO2_12_FULL_58_11 TaxID=1817867 RepID=A0A1F5YJW6_9BACT|nr:MAG: dTDP-4-dehydrorhamnose 3,5-epimerase [Candidatus Glassbacteria bacterium RIFCSPLOWO2_12_FULL_58_11]
MIEGVVVKKLKVVPDERGRLMEILRDDDTIFTRFGQVYMTTNFPGVVKAWHYHLKQSDCVTCVHGMIKLVLCDWRKESKTYKTIEEYFIGEHNPLLIKIPPQVLHGWKGIGVKETIVVNVPDQHYDYEQPDELRLPFDSPEVGYDWEIKFF